MTISINGNKIIFDNYALEFSPSGISANGNFIFAQGQPLQFFKTGEFQGTTAGYVLYNSPTSTTTLLNIDRFPFATTTTVTDAGDILSGWTDYAGHSSDISGYATKGNIFKFNFATNVGTITTGVATGLSATQSLNGYSTSTHGYITGGWFPSQNRIERFPFATDSANKNVGKLAYNAYRDSQTQSETTGYSMGGPAASTSVQKFPFATDSPSTNLGALLPTYHAGGGGLSSITHGYIFGGNSTGGFPSAVNTMQKFPFSTEGAASLTTNLLQLRQWCRSGISSRDFGYVSGGGPYPGGSPGNINVIERFPFANESAIADVADLTQAKPTGQGIQD